MRERRQNLVLLSKLQAPQIKTKTLYRERLVEVLRTNLDKKVILLCAGAGYGKTTLLIQFLSKKEIPYVYYHLEKSDAEPVVFFSYLIAGIRRIEIEFGKKTERLSHFFNYPQRYLEIIVSTFINEFIEHITDNLYIILEDYHALYPAEQIDTILTYLLDHLPPHLHLIITSRVAPPISISQLHAQNEILELGSEHLRFTRDEIKNLFSEVYSLSLKTSELDWIETHSEGWPTSLRLMLQSSNYFEGRKSSGYIRRILESYYQSQSNLFNYFAQEIYNQEPKNTRQFLVDCSVLGWLTPQLCDAVTRRKNSGDILADLTTRNAFLFRMPGMGYRFHHLFKDFLSSKIIETDRERKIYRRAGDFYAKEERLEEAIKFYLQAKEHERAASIIEKIGFSLVEQGRSGTLCSYVEKIPKSLIVQRPLLLMNYARSLIYVGRSEEAKDNCLRATKLLKSRVKMRKKYADALYELGGINLNQGRFTAAKKWFAKALSVCPKSSKLTRASILNSIGSIYTAIGGKNLQEGIKYFDKALRIAQRYGYRDLEASILNNWAMNEFKQGNLSVVYPKLAKTVDLLQTHFSPGCGAGFYNAARTGLFLGYIKEARSILDSGIKTCSSYNDLWSMARIWEGWALLYQELDDLKKAEQFATRALGIYEKLGIVRLITSALNELSRINIKAGELVDAERNLSKAWVLQESQGEFEAVPLLLTEAKLRIIQNKLTDAEHLLHQALKLSQRFGQIFNMFLINAELSKVFYLQGRIAEVVSTLKKVVMTCRTKGYEYLLLHELQQERWMLQIISRENIEKKYLMSLIKKAKLDVRWVDAFLFGIPRLIIDDHEIADAAWKTIKAKKLFCYLLLHKAEKVSQDTLIDALWQNASYKSGSDSLRKALQHVRTIFKSNIADKGDILTSGKGSYQISPHISIKLDTEKFQALVKKAKELREQNNEYEDYLKEAISLYKTGFAIGWYDSWVEELRRFYQSMYEDCLIMMGDLSFGKKRYKEATLWYKKLVSLNFYNEEYHRKLMKAYSKIGRYKEIAKDFEQLRKALKKELDAEPQRETIALYKSLVS